MTRKSDISKMLKQMAITLRLHCDTKARAHTNVFHFGLTHEKKDWIFKYLIKKNFGQK